MTKQIQKTFRKDIKALDKAIRNHKNRLAESNFPVTHHFTDGLYTRETVLPADTVVVGKIHRHNHMMMLLKGTAIIASQEGVEILHAPVVKESKAGIQRAVHALTDCVFVTTHVTNETNLTKLEAEIIAPSYKELEKTDVVDSKRDSCSRVTDG